MTAGTETEKGLRGLMMQHLKASSGQTLIHSSLHHSGETEKTYKKIEDYW